MREAKRREEIGGIKKSVLSKKSGKGKGEKGGRG